MTLPEFAANKDARLHLAKLLEDPVMKAVLEMMKDANLPQMVLQLPNAPPSMDPIMAIALSASLRAGFQNALSLLKKLPSMDAVADRQALHTLPWEWTAQPDTPKPNRPRRAK